MRRQDQVVAVSFDLARQVFRDDRDYSGAMSDPPRRLRQAEHRSMSGDRCRSYDRPPPYEERRYGQDVPFDHRARMPPMECCEMERHEMERHEMEMRRWEERPCRHCSPRFERGPRPFRPGFMARGRPFVPRGRPVTRAHMTASMRETDMTSPHIAPQGHNPNPVVALHRVDATVDARALQGGNAPPVDERLVDRIYCPTPGCSRSYSQFRSEKNVTQC